MSLDFKKLSDVDSVESLEDGDYILTVADGAVKKIKKSDAKFGTSLISVDRTFTDYSESSNAICYNGDEIVISVADDDFSILENGGRISINLDWGSVTLSNNLNFLKLVSGYPLISTAYPDAEYNRGCFVFNFNGADVSVYIVPESQWADYND